MVLADPLIAPTMRRLADDGVIAGESGAAALAGLAAAASDSAARAVMGLDHNSRVLALSTEGATDPEIYQRMVGRSAEAVLTNRRP
jgi:diaminopropionate ammonia-lyase